MPENEPPTKSEPVIFITMDTNLKKLLSSEHATEKPKAMRDLLRNPTIVAATISVIGTALVGAIISGIIQERSKENELALTAYKEHTTAQLTAINDVFELIGKYLNAADNMIQVTGPRFHPKRPTQAEQQQLTKDIQRLLSQTTEFDAEWQRRREAIGYLLAYHAEGAAPVKDAWNRVKQGAETYYLCALKRLDAYNRGEQLTVEPIPCQQEKIAFANEIETLRNALQNDRKFPWKTTTRILGIF